MNLTDNESIFCQTLAMTSLITTLNSENFLQSEYYNKLYFIDNNDNFKEILKKSRIGNPATMQMFLYALLVMPKEILERYKSGEYIKQYEMEINCLCATLVEEGTNSSYKGEKDILSINYYQRIRNAVSHARCSYHEKDKITYVTFKDINKNKSSEQCEIIMKTEDVDTIIGKLRIQIMEFLNKEMEKNRIL